MDKQLKYETIQDMVSSGYTHQEATEIVEAMSWLANNVERGE